MMAAALFAAACLAPEAGLAAAMPSRVMSINLCTDQLVLALLPRERIASVSWLARDRSLSAYADAAQAIPVNHGEAADVLARQPDLVITGTGSKPATRALLHRLGYRVLEVPPASDFAGIRVATRMVAQALGEGPRAERLLAAMDADLSAVARDPARRLRVVAWDETGFNASRGSLYDALLRLAGADNVGADLPELGPPDAERLLQRAPDLLVLGDSAAHDRGPAAALSRHRLIRQIWGTRRTVSIDPAAYTCGTPLVGREALALRDRLRKAGASR